MDTFRPQRSPGSDRFLGVFTTPEAGGADGDELHEDDVFWTGPEPDRRSPRPAPPSMLNPNPSPSSSSSSIPAPSDSEFRRIPDRNFGILAALSEDDSRCSPPFLQRRPSISSASTSPSSARMIPTIPKPEIPKAYRQSAPVSVPMRQKNPVRGWGEAEFEGGGSEEDDDEMLPPHEIVARASGKNSPKTTFSVLEGAGRTLKGRDLRRVRNAVWRKTGFLD